MKEREAVSADECWRIVRSYLRQVCGEVPSVGFSELTRRVHEEKDVGAGGYGVQGEAALP